MEENNFNREESDTESIKGAIDAMVLEVDSLPVSKTSNEQFLTSFGYVLNSEVMGNRLANKAHEHTITTEIPRHTEKIGQLNLEKFPYTFTSTSLLNRLNSSNFHSIMIDTGASKISTAGYDQYIACQKFNSYVKIDKSKAWAINVQFGIGSAPSIGFKLNTPVGVTEFHVVHADTPFLLCLADMDRLKIYYNNVDNVLVTSTGKRIPVVRQFGHPFLTWGESLPNFLETSFENNPCYLTETELRRLQRRFGHPSAERLYRLLKRAGHVPDQKFLHHPTKFCVHCQKRGKSLGIFKFAL
ncbi:hypothetical protein K3495_g15098 [Podosphaera aphanis]|nr:hypothetical protein K3495_g15098 [Podosphaera aphanis]